MILRDRCSTSYDLASIFRGRRSTLDRWSGKIGKDFFTALQSTSILQLVCMFGGITISYLTDQQHRVFPPTCLGKPAFLFLLSAGTRSPAVAHAAGEWATADTR